MKHYHIQLWVENAPVLGKSPIEDVASFISKYITCHLPDKLAFPTLHHRVKKFQTHSHNNYCMRA